MIFPRAHLFEQTEMPETLSRAASELKRGEVTEVIGTEVYR